MRTTLSLIGLIVMSITLTQCAKDRKELSKHITGYWEIVSVSSPHGTTKKYGVSTTIDYINIKESEGFRKKVQPNFKGTYTTSDNAQPIKLITEGNRLFLSYNNTTNIRREEVIDATLEKLVLKNEEQLLYTYRRYTPLNITN